MSTRSFRQLRRLAGALAVVVLTTAGCATSGGGGGGTPPPGPGGLAVCPPKGAGQIQVAVVVDAIAFGGTADTVCVVVPAGSTGVTALAARAQRLGSLAPRYAPNGLLCAIDGVPLAPACGQNGPNGPEYWSYWPGGTTWTYAPTGPATRALIDRSVDGWRFIQGGTNAPPRVASSSFDDLTS